ncbi:MAG: hypothetical protein E6J04_02880 [Chloroflexi bacterium]|nr:MAG: hypothetical protein E6J04_02880 [Chloroflexota bacterium]
MDYSPPPEDSSMLGTQFRNIPLTLSQDITSLDTQPQRIPLPQKPRRVSRNTRRHLAIVLLLSISLLIIVSATIIVPVLKTRNFHTHTDTDTGF